MASVSSAAGLSRRGRNANCARSITSAYSRRVRNCHPCRISSSAARTAAAPACGSSVASSSTGSGRNAENSAASSSFARGLTANHDRSERPILPQPERPTLGELEQRDESRQRVHQAGALAHDVAPSELGALGEQRLDLRGRTLHVERPRHHAVQHRLGNQRNHPLRRREQIVQLDHQGRGRARRRLGGEAPPELLRAPRGCLRQPLHELADLLVLEQPAHQLGPGILPLVVAEAARQQQVKRARELLELDDEAGLLLGHGGRCSHETPGSAKPPTRLHPRRMSAWTGHRNGVSSVGTNARTKKIGMNPNAYSCRNRSPARGGSSWYRTWLPSSGGIGIRLKNASTRLSVIPYSSMRWKMARLACSPGRPSPNRPIKGNSAAQTRNSARFMAIPARDTIPSPFR